MNKKSDNSDNKVQKSKNRKRGFVLPTTSSKPPMPPVIPPKKK